MIDEAEVTSLINEYSLAPTKTGEMLTTSVWKFFLCLELKTFGGPSSREASITESMILYQYGHVCPRSPNTIGSGLL